VSLAAWIVLGVVAFAFVLLAVVMLVLVRHLARLHRAATGLKARAAEAERLQARLDELQPRISEIAEQVELVQAKLPHR
jgi:HAMP domain-containing protein